MSPREPESVRAALTSSPRIADDPNAAEVVKISEGQLFLVRAESVRGGRECMYVVVSRPVD